jgi:hypothetical protein
VESKFLYYFLYYFPSKFCIIVVISLEIDRDVTNLKFSRTTKLLGVNSGKYLPLTAVELAYLIFFFWNS